MIFFITVSGHPAPVAVQRRGRGRSKNLALERWRREHAGQHLPIEILPGYTTPTTGWCEPWRTELGIICRYYAPVTLFDWRQVTPAQRDVFYSHLQVK